MRELTLQTILQTLQTWQYLPLYYYSTYMDITRCEKKGVEDGMTFGGKDFGNKDDFFFKMYPAVTAVYVVLLLIANYVTQPL